MKKSGKSGGKGIIPLPPGRFFLLTLLFTLLAAAGVRAQNPPVSINAKAITINELFIRIEKQGVYTFAYNNADIDLKRIVTVHAKERPIESIVRECLPEVNVQVSNNKVILTGRRSDQSSMPMHKLTGTVTDENGAPVTGATVIVVGTQRGTTTSATGAYTLQVRNGEILEFQYLGYEKQAVSVGGQTTLDVTLQPSKAMAVDEVVVIGYGTVKKGDATGAVRRPSAAGPRRRRRHHVHHGRTGRHDFDPHPRYALDLGLERTADRGGRRDGRRQRPQRPEHGRHRIGHDPQGRLLDGDLRITRLQRRNHRNDQGGG